MIRQLIEWLLNTCPEFYCGQAVVRSIGSKDEEDLCRYSRTVARKPSVGGFMFVQAGLTFKI